MTVLIIGGTSDARQIATQLYTSGVPVIYTIAGLVRKTPMACPVMTGGFTQHGGLVQYIKRQNIKAIVNSTHPYSATMSNTASLAAQACNIPCWRFLRPAWEADEKDQWQMFDDITQIFNAVADKQSLFITAGQLTQANVDHLSKVSHKQQKQLLRVAMPPKHRFPNSMQWIKAIGPFNVDNELAIFKEHAIDAVISKNSGGDATFAKIVAARALNVPVFMLNRPTPVKANKTFDSIEACTTLITDLWC